MKILKKEISNISDFSNLIFENKTQSYTYISSPEIKDISNNIYITYCSHLFNGEEEDINLISFVLFLPGSVQLE